MEKTVQKRTKLRTKRTLRVRKHLRGTGLKPRLCVVKTNKHIYAQLIDDEAGKTLASASTRTKALQTTENNKKSKTSAKILGEMIAKEAKALGVTHAVFDRGRFKYHGILAAFADTARENGLRI